MYSSHQFCVLQATEGLHRCGTTVMKQMTVVSSYRVLCEVHSILPLSIPDVESSLLSLVIWRNILPPLSPSFSTSVHLKLRTVIMQSSKFRIFLLCNKENCAHWSTIAHFIVHLADWSLIQRTIYITASVSRLLHFSHMECFKLNHCSGATSIQILTRM